MLRPCCLSVSILFAGAAFGQLPVEQPSDQPKGPVARILERAHGEEPVPAEQLVREIVDLGASALPEVLDTLAMGGGGGGLREIPGRGADVDGVLRQVLQASPRDMVATAVLARLEPDSTVHDRLAAVQTLTELGGAGLLDPVLTVLVPMDPIHFRRQYVMRRLEPALRRALEEDSFARASVETRLAELDAGLLACLASALSSSPADVELLVELLGRDPYLDDVVLRKMSGLSSVAVLNERGMQRVRGFLDKPDVGLRKAAVLALGRLHDEQTAPRFVELLYGNDHTLVRAAHESLRTMSGLGWEPEPEQWRRWMVSELEWVDGEAATLGETVTGDDISRAVRACRELASHRLPRREVGTYLRRGLEHRNPAVVAAACTGLGRLGDPSAAGVLVNHLTHAEDIVGTAALQALQSITGKSLGRDPDAWWTWLEG